MRTALRVAALVVPALVAGCTGGWPSANGVANRAPRHCAPEYFGVNRATRVGTAQAANVVAGHLPAQIPSGFGLQEVDRVNGDGGFVSWTDSDCRRVAVFYAPGVSSVDGGVHAFGPWMKLPRCGKPRPCVVYQGAVGGGIITLSTWRLDPRIAPAVLRTVPIDAE